MNNEKKKKKIQKDEKLIKSNDSSFVSNHVLRNIHNHEEHIYLMVALEGTDSSYNGF